MAATNNRRSWKALVLINRMFAGAYATLSCMIAWQTLLGNTNVYSSVALIVFVIALALGHLTLKDWSLKTTAAIFLVIALFSLPYLFSVFEKDLVPPTQERALKFFLILLLATTAVTNYLFYKRLRKEHAS